MSLDSFLEHLTSPEFQREAEELKVKLHAIKQGFYPTTYLHEIPDRDERSKRIKLMFEALADQASNHGNPKGLPKKEAAFLLQQVVKAKLGYEIELDTAYKDMNCGQQLEITHRDGTTEPSPYLIWHNGQKVPLLIQWAEDKISWYGCNPFLLDSVTLQKVQEEKTAMEVIAK